MTPVLVLLPGLDGSGVLFAPLLAALGSEIDCRVLPLPTDGGQTPQQLAECLLPQLPQQPYVLLAESFSGAIALEIAKRKPESLRQLILVATFLESPRPWLRLLPDALLKMAWQVHRPLVSLWWPLCGERKDIAARALVLHALRALSWPVLRARLRAIQALDLQPSALSCPVAVFHAGADYLVPNSVHFRLNQLGPAMVIPGPHFLLQSRVDEMATWIRKIILIPEPSR